MDKGSVLRGYGKSITVPVPAQHRTCKHTVLPVPVSCLTYNSHKGQHRPTTSQQRDNEGPNDVSHHLGQVCFYFICLIFPLMIYLYDRFIGPTRATDGHQRPTHASAGHRETANKGSFYVVNRVIIIIIIYLLNL
jgi:hypothetical protein